MIARHPYDALRRIATPREGMAKCSTPERYARAHELEMAAKRQAYPFIEFYQMPWESPDKPLPFVAGGKWVVHCTCNDAPMASPDWDEARCFTCGAIYRGLAWPSDRLEIEELLLDRPSAANRGWLQHETVNDLREQNAAHGIVSKARSR